MSYSDLCCALGIDVCSLNNLCFSYASIVELFVRKHCVSSAILTRIVLVISHSIGFVNADFSGCFVFRYNEAVLMNFGTSKEILKLANQIQEWFNKFFLCLDSAKSWHDISVRGAFAFKACAGNQQLNWRNKGYKTILDVLMVGFTVNPDKNTR